MLKALDGVRNDEDEDTKASDTDGEGHEDREPSRAPSHAAHAAAARELLIRGRIGALRPTAAAVCATAAAAATAVAAATSRGCKKVRHGAVCVRKKRTQGLGHFCWARAARVSRALRGPAASRPRDARDSRARAVAVANGVRIITGVAIRTRRRAHVRF